MGESQDVPEGFSSRNWKKKMEFLSLAGERWDKGADSSNLAGQLETVGADPEDNLETSAGNRRSSQRQRARSLKQRRDERGQGGSQGLGNSG